MTQREMERLLARFGQDIFAFCCYLTGSRDTGEELYQDTMLKTIERMEQIELRGEGDEGLLHARNYCLGVAVRLNKSLARKEIRRMHPSLDDEENGFDYVISDPLTPEQRLIEQQEIQSIRNAVRSLSEKYREVVYLYYYAEQSVKEIAETLHIPQGTVKSRMNYAKKVLARLLREESL